MDVHVKIGAIILYCDETVQKLNIGNGYIIQKMNQQELFYSDKIIDGGGNLDISYMGSKLTFHENIETKNDKPITYFICLTKEDTFAVTLPPIQAEIPYTDNDMACTEQLEEYKNNEFQFLNTVFSLLQLFKEGNIGLKKVFFEYRYQANGFLNFTKNHSIDISDANYIRQNFFHLSNDDIVDCNAFITKWNSPEYALMRNVIDEFVFGLKQIDDATGFEQFTTALEMIFLVTNQTGKKECLSKRIAALLGTNYTEVLSIYGKIKNYYRYRSESLHEGDGSNITQAEMSEMANIVRKCIKKYLIFCETAIAIDANVSWDDIKSQKIEDLKQMVETYKVNNALPS